MAQPGITLGGIVFTNHDTGGLSGANPENVKFGLKEQIVVHKMIGGARILDMMGDDPEDISWSGFWLGPNAADRANELYALEQGKELLDLTFGVYNATVVISQLDLNYKKAFYIEYSITCIVIDQAVGEAIGGGGALEGLVNFEGFDAANQLLDLANNALNGINNVVDAANGLIQGVNGLQQAVQGPVNALNNLGNQVGNLIGFA